MVEVALACPRITRCITLPCVKFNRHLVGYRFPLEGVHQGCTFLLSAIRYRTALVGNS